VKRFFFTTLVLLGAASPAWAQESLMELYRADLKAEKTAILTENLQLTDAEATTFWPIYREYDLKLSALQDERFALLKDYAAAYDNIGPETATTLMEKALTLEEKRMKLRHEYFKKVSKAVSPLVAARFAHVESVIQNLVDLQVQTQIPLVHKPTQGEGGGE